MSGSTVIMGQDFKGDRGSVVAAVVYTADSPGTGTDCSPWDGSVAANLVTGMTQANGDYTRDGASEQYGPVLHGLGWGLDGVTWRPVPLQVPGDSQANPSTGIVHCLAKMQYWAGADWRRVYGIGNTSIAQGATGAMNTAAYNYTFDGTSHQPLKSDGQQALIATVTDPAITGAPPAASNMYSAGGTTVSANVKASAGRLFSVHARISHATAAGAWLMLFDKSTAPAGGDTPIWRAWIQVNTATNISAEAGRDHFGPQGLPFANGLSWGVSTTAATYTAIGAVVNGHVNISYK